MGRNVLVLLIFTILPKCQLLAEDSVNFSRHILPILSENCFSCHGPDQSNRKAGLRLDTAEGALKVIDLKNPDKSELIERITSKDEAIVMPPPESHKKTLLDHQVKMVKNWIKDGARWGKHWSFEIPSKADIPLGYSNPVDAFIRDRLRKEKLKFNNQAPAHTLARRISFDLTGLPPSPNEIKAFLESGDEKEYLKLVDDLLNSKHFGERMAMWWLDAARYADTDGYQGDETRTNWPWRDWVVNAFNNNMSFKQFTIEQFAGDQIPNSSIEQKIATCFHRNHMTNGEGGRDPEESRTEYVIDRINTIGTLWLGLTLGCAQCHSHKYDPISQKDFYSLTAFFNSIDEDGKAGKGAKPLIPYESPTIPRTIKESQTLVDQRKKIEQDEKLKAQKPFDEWLKELLKNLNLNYKSWDAPEVIALESSEGTLLKQLPDSAITATGPNPRQDDYRISLRSNKKRITGLKLEVIADSSHTNNAYSRGKSGFFTLTDIKVQTRKINGSQVRDIPVANAIADHSDDPKKHSGYGDIKNVLDDDPRNGWSTRDANNTQNHHAVFALAQPLQLADDEVLIFELRHRSTIGDANIGKFKVYTTSELGPVLKSLGDSPTEKVSQLKIEDIENIDKKLRELLFEQFLADHSPYIQAKFSLDRAIRQLEETKAAKTTNIMVLQERKEPRKTHVLTRGIWDKKAEEVQLAIPSSLGNWPASKPKTRLELADWLTSDKNPLTARVTVNNIWQMLFGTGLVKTSEDFGLQGEQPSHPELLDWLAIYFMENNWDLKKLIQLIVTSQTYRQSSIRNQDTILKDPENRLLSRGPRHRLPSWMLRDGALKISGLLNSEIGGPPIKPYQPEGVWEEMFMGRFKYEATDGPAQYKRSLYSFWRRAVAPTFLFDSAQRRVCEVRISRTNTPLQALTLLNDATFLEASLMLSIKINSASLSTDESIKAIMTQLLFRQPNEIELAILKKEHGKNLAFYENHPSDAEKLIISIKRNIDWNGELKLKKIEHAKIAANTLLASMIFNLDEAVTNE